MSSTRTEWTEVKTGRFPRVGAAWLALALLLIATTVIRFNISPFRPLWLDEVQTGMLVTQPTLADFVRECGYDVNGPLYSVLALIWAHFSGVSNQALRLLPEVFGTAAPLLALTAGNLIDRLTRFTWCALLACWIPGIWYSQEARPYALAFMLAVANVVTFSQVIKAPTRRAAWSWTIVASLLILTHYFAAAVVACQGLAYLARHRKRALATWPAALAFLAPAASLAEHAAGLVRFATPGTGWIQPQQAHDLWRYVGFVFGMPLLFVITLIWLAALLLVWFATRKAAAQALTGGASHLWLAASCSVAALGLAVALGFVRPVLIPRYLTVFVPGIFLAVALCAGRIAPQFRLAGTPLVAFFAWFTIAWAEQSHFMAEPFTYEFASQWIMRAHPNRVVFLWDTPMRPARTTLAGLGGFFFRRAGLPVTMDGVELAEGEDPNKALTERAAEPGSAILWIYDLAVNGTAAIRYHPALSKLDATLACRNFGGRQFGIIACTHGRPVPAGFARTPLSS